jgi:hypothetical protein
MVKSLSLGRTMKFAVLLAIIAAADMAVSQDTILRMQRSTAALEIDSNAKHGQGISGVTTGNPGDVWHYPNSLACLLVYTDGRYVLEKRDEVTVGKPKTKLAEGSFTADEIQQLKAILGDEALKQLTTPRLPNWPDDAVALHEIESLNVQIDRGGSSQTILTVKERLKTRAMTGLDTWLDNSTPYQKTMAPLVKWFKDVEKKSKSALKDAKPQYCAPINIE